MAILGVLPLLANGVQTIDSTRYQFGPTMTESYGPALSLVSSTTISARIPMEHSMPPDTIISKQTISTWLRIACP